MSQSSDDPHSSPDLERHYSGYFLLRDPSDALAGDLDGLVGRYPFFDRTSSGIELEYQGRDSSRVVVDALRELARIVGDAEGEVRCQVAGDTDQLFFEFYRVRGGVLFRQRGDVVRGPEEAVSGD